VACSESPPISKKSSSMPMSARFSSRCQISATRISSGAAGGGVSRLASTKAAESRGREILPVGPTGRLSTMWTWRGRWKGARRS
jgi:hypothetical protein